MVSNAENPLISFEGILKPVENTSAMMIDFPFSVEELFGVKGQVKIVAHYDGIPYRGSLAKMGRSCHFLVVRIDILKQLGKKAGETVQVTVQKDLEERIVELPPELAERVFGRIKYLARLKTYQESLPQDGRIAKEDLKCANDLRVATYPTVTGEKIVLRMFQNQVGQELSELALPSGAQSAVTAFLRRASGLLLLTGPAGSGKTTTIYGCLR